MLDKIAKIDERFSRYWYAHRFSQKTDRLLRLYTRLGDGYVWALVILWLFLADGAEFLGRVAIQVAFSIAVSLALYWLVKLSTKRRRPFDAIPEFQALVPPLDKFSFPSGHTMNNLAVASTVFLSAPGPGALMMALPLSWGLLRVYFGVHWISDVIGGFALGIASFAIGHFLWLAFWAGNGLWLS